MSIVQIYKEKVTKDIVSNEVKKEKKKTHFPKMKNIEFDEPDSYITNLIHSRPYPDFRFFCPFCSSLDVFITINKKEERFIVDCLDCNKKWLDYRC